MEEARLRLVRLAEAQGGLFKFGGSHEPVSYIVSDVSVDVSDVSEVPHIVGKSIDVASAMQFFKHLSALDYRRWFLIFGSARVLAVLATISNSETCIVIHDFSLSLSTSSW